MAGGSTYREDLPLVMNRKGYDEQTWFTFSYSPVRDESGKVAGMFCAVSETTRKVLAERALRDLNETLERRVAEAVAERNILADIFEGEEFTEVGEFGDPDRDRRAYEMRYNTLRDRHGNRIGAYQFVYDVTERLREQQRLRDTEEALRHAQKMESMGQLTGGVAHDFNNLLAVFSNGLELLKRDISAESRQTILEGMRRALVRGTSLTRHLLAFSGRRPVHPESINPSAHLTAMREMLGSSLGGNVHIEARGRGWACRKSMVSRNSAGADLRSTARSVWVGSSVNLRRASQFSSAGRARSEGTLQGRGR